LKKYNNNQWTQARFNSFVKGALRAASQRWPPKYSVLTKAFTSRKENKATGRLAKHFECNKCKQEFPQKEVEVNHISPIVPVTGFDSWDKVIERLFCEEEGLEVVCKPCHKSITKEENIIRKSK
jgi:ribosomal protein L44E